jgi:choloylglycine hydrolase
MCTAISFQTKDHYFGRNLDFTTAFDTAVTIMPRNYSLTLRNGETFSNHYGMIGMAMVTDNYPLFFEATNEKGLSIAGLNFPGNATYHPPAKNKYNITPFELTPWLLGRCRDLTEARIALTNINLTNISYSPSLPLTPLHWFISDSTGSLVIESTPQGLQIYENPIGILTNNPPFPYQFYNLANYLNITADEPTNRFSPNYPLLPYSYGMGGIGLPGDLSSASRFVRAAFTKLNAICGEDEPESISQFFHILGAVSQTRGCVKVANEYEITLYTSCCNTQKGIYYYTTYENSQITAVRMTEETLSSGCLISYPLRKEQAIQYEN